MKRSGIKEEIEKNYVKAIESYKKELSSSKAPASSYINLAFLYWIIAKDFGFYTYYQIPEELRTEASTKYTELLENGQKLFPKNLEIQFWIKYLSHRDYDEEFTAEQCIDLLSSPELTASLVPYFFLKLLGIDDFHNEVAALLKICLEEPTAKNEYIRSIIE